MSAAEQLAPEVGTAAACRALAVSRATLYRRRRQAGADGARPGKRPCPRRLAEQERGKVLEVLHSERFVDTAPA